MHWLNPSFIFLVFAIGCHRSPVSTPNASPHPSTNPFPITVEDSGSAEVDALVRKLVSERPAPYPDGYWPVPNELVLIDKYATPEVTNAIMLLKQKGPSIFPNLIHHLHDQRYSFSTVVAAWDNCSVGDAIVEVLCDGEYTHSGYKGRDSPKGFCAYVSFSDYVRAKRESEWAGWAKNRTRLEIQLDFIDWCVSKEEERGFIGESQKAELIARYQAAREQMKRKYAGANGSTSRISTSHSESSATPAEAGAHQ